VAADVMAVIEEVMEEEQGVATSATITETILATAATAAAATDGVATSSSAMTEAILATAAAAAASSAAADTATAAATASAADNETQPGQYAAKLELSEDVVQDDDKDLPNPASATTTTTTTTNGESKRLWGSTGSNHASGDASTDSNESTSSQPPPQQQQQQQMPFVPKQQHHTPPEGFVLAARVYTDPTDKLSHFDLEPAALTVPYWDCGVAGSTTPSMSLKHGYFRHALAATTTVISSNNNNDSSGSGYSQDRMHPVLVVALSPVTIEVNAGEIQHFLPGDVILLEDVLRPGHKMRPSHQSSSSGSGTSAGSGSGGTHHHPADVQLLFLTLPNPYHHMGKEHVSLAALGSNSQSRLALMNPCPNTVVPSGSISGISGSSTTSESDTMPELESSGTSASSSSGSGSATETGYAKDTSRTTTTHPFLLYQPPSSPLSQWLNHPDAARWVVLGVAGLSASTLVADFLGKTAPLWLAVGVGGGCFVAASTYCFCQAGNAVWTALEVWYQQRRLGESPSPSSSSSSSNLNNDNDKDGNEQYVDDTGRLLQKKTSGEATASTTTPAAFEAM
jgi:hypothetical protein